MTPISERVGVGVARQCDLAKPESDEARDWYEFDAVSCVEWVTSARGPPMFRCAGVQFPARYRDAWRELSVARTADVSQPRLRCDPKKMSRVALGTPVSLAIREMTLPAVVRTVYEE